MTTTQLPNAEVLYEQYKMLSDDGKQRLRNLILADKLGVTLLPDTEADDQDDEEGGDIIRISLPALYESIELVKQIRAGTAETISVEELFASLEDDDEPGD